MEIGVRGTKTKHEGSPKLAIAVTQRTGNVEAESSDLTLTSLDNEADFQETESEEMTLFLEQEDKMLDEKTWKVLLERISQGNCTPFIGAGTCYGVLPLGGEISRDWANEHGYPLDDGNDLVRVAQFLALKYEDPVFPKEEILKAFKGKTPDFSDPHEPHRVLANLPLPVYLTTNYDDFMTQALTRRQKDVKREFCAWNGYVKNFPSIFKTRPDYVPTVANPLVFHLHGHSGVPESLVLTEDDYLDFLVNFSNDENIIPFPIQRALSATSILFIGYRIADWNLRTILRAISRLEQSGRRRGVATMLLPVNASDPEKQARAEEYLTKYYGKIDVTVYWGTAREFLKELGTRWEAFGA